MPRDFNEVLELDIKSFKDLVEFFAFRLAYYLKSEYLIAK